MKQSINQSMGPKEWIMITALSLVWGGSFFFTGVAVRELPSLTIVFSRVSIAAVAMSIVLFAKQIPIPF